MKALPTLGDLLKTLEKIKKVFFFFFLSFGDNRPALRKDRLSVHCFSGVGVEGSRESGLGSVGCSAADAGIGVADERYSLDDLLPGLGEPGMDAHVDCFR